MEVLNLRHSPAIFMPLWAFSDPVLKGSEMVSGVNINMGTNKFFKNLFIAEPDAETMRIGQELASERPVGDVGIILVTKHNHLTVIAERWRDKRGMKYRLPIIWNARLMENESDITSDTPYFHVYCDGKKSSVVGNGYLAYEEGRSVLWTPGEAAAFQGGWR